MKRATRSAVTNRQASTKRPKTGRRAPPVVATGSAALRVVAEPFLLDTIVAFMPVVPTPLARRDDALHFVWLTQALTGATQSTRYARENQAFWTEKLFAYFDFSLERRGGTGSVQFHDLNAIRITHDPAWKAQRAARNKRLRRRYWQRDRDDENDVIEELPPDAFLTEEFVLWKHLYVYHRASQYGFLTDIQTGIKDMSAFPESINASELFEDLAVLVSELRANAVSSDSRSNTFTVADPEIYPCLLRRMPKKVTPRGSDLLDVCAISATFWDSSARMVSAPWPGLAPASHRALMASRFGKDVDESEMVLQHESEAQYDDFFGRWGARERVQLEEAVRRRFVDWRHVRVHNDDGPQFYVGRRLGSNRWMGFLSCAV